MEILANIKNLDLLPQYQRSGVNGFIVNSLFSIKNYFTPAQVDTINKYCRIKKIKFYVNVDVLVSEEDIEDLHRYLDYIHSLGPDGIYFSDLAVLYYMNLKGYKTQLIYDPSTLNTNDLDVSFYLNQGVDVVLARELTIREVVDIVKNHPKQIDMQVFGHLRMSYSKRKFLSNYFKEIEEKIDVDSVDDLSLIEESRNYKLPIRENIYGTAIYTDYVLLMYEELAYLTSALKRAIIDTEFVPEEIAIEVIRDIRRLSKDNAKFLSDNIKNSHFYIDFSNGYLYQKTTDKKENDEKD